MRGFNLKQNKTMTQKEVLKAMRGVTGKNMTEFGNMVGLDHSRISKYENEKYAITLPMFLEWCEKIEKKPEEIFAQLK